MASGQLCISNARKHEQCSAAEGTEDVVHDEVTVLKAESIRQLLPRLSLLLIMPFSHGHGTIAAACDTESSQHAVGTSVRDSVRRQDTGSAGACRCKRVLVRFRPREVDATQRRQHCERQ